MLAFYESLTCPDPPIMLPYMVNMKRKVETMMSAAMELTEILPMPEWGKGYMMSRRSIGR